MSNNAVNTAITILNILKEKTFILNCKKNVIILQFYFRSNAALVSIRDIKTISPTTNF